MDWLEPIGRLGAQLLKIALGTAMLGGSAYLAYRLVADKWSTITAWFFGLLLWGVGAAVMLALFGTSFQALGRASCYGVDDFQACLDGDYAQDLGFVGRACVGKLAAMIAPIAIPASCHACFYHGTT